MGGRISSALLRYNADGTRDVTFDDHTFEEGGAVLTNTGSPASEVTLQPDGKILVSLAQQLGLLRFNSDGSLDGTFDGDGIGANASKRH